MAAGSGFPPSLHSIRLTIKMHILSFNMAFYGANSAREYEYDEFWNETLG
jgi:hypothetical protein